MNIPEGLNDLLPEEVLKRRLLKINKSDF